MFQQFVVSSVVLHENNVVRLSHTKNHIVQIPTLVFSYNKLALNFLILYKN